MSQSPLVEPSVRTWSVFRSTWIARWADLAPDKIALRCDDESLSYGALESRIADAAGTLTARGVAAGTRVAYLGLNSPELPITLFACARIGAIHSVVFGGFAPRELAIRIDDAKPKLLLTASAGKEIDREIDYLPLVDNNSAENRARNRRVEFVLEKENDN